MENKQLCINVRLATPKDAETMLQIQKECIEKVFPPFYPQTTRDLWISLLNIDSYIAKIQTTGWTFVAFDTSNKDVIGYAYLNTDINYPPLIPKQYACDLQVESLYIRVDHHRQGIGKQLMQEIEKKATNEGCTRVGVLASMPAVSFYETLGYSFFEKRWYNFKPEKPEDKFTDKESPCGIEARVMLKNLEVK